MSRGDIAILMALLQAMGEIMGKTPAQLGPILQKAQQAIDDRRPVITP